MEKLTNKQKLILVRNRIFGLTINDGFRTGAKYMKRQIPYWRTQHLEWVHSYDTFPWFKDPESIMEKEAKYEERKHRIVMRGVKIGQKKGGNTVGSNVSMFETKK
jgi:hypothetical protein